MHPLTVTHVVIYALAVIVSLGVMVLTAYCCLEAIREIEK